VGGQQVSQPFVSSQQAIVVGWQHVHGPRKLVPPWIFFKSSMNSSFTMRPSKRKRV